MGQTRILLPLPARRTWKGELEPDVAYTQVEDFLDPRAGVEHQREHGVIPLPRQRAPIDAGQQDLDLGLFQVFDGGRAGSSLERNPEDLLQSRHVVGVSSDEEARKGVQSGEPCIAGGDAVLTCGFQEGKEAADPIVSDIGNFQRFRSPVRSL